MSRHVCDLCHVHPCPHDPHDFHFQKEEGAHIAVGICSCGELDVTGLNNAVETWAVRNGQGILKSMLEAAQQRARTLEKWVKLVADLDRCKHGRHQGDVCAGWRGPGLQDGGCQGGISLGNLGLQPGDRIGFALSGREITVPPRDKKYDVDAWYRRTRDHGTPEA